MFKMDTYRQGITYLEVSVIAIDEGGEFQLLRLIDGDISYCYWFKWKNDWSDVVHVFVALQQVV